MRGLLLAMLLGVCSLSAEVERLDVRWNPLLCNVGCSQRIVQGLQALPFVAQMTVSQTGGQATLTFKPNMAFNYASLAMVFSRAGVSLDDLRIKVRGNIRIVGNQFYLVSLGDNTAFALVSTPQQTLPGTTLADYVTMNLQLTPYLQQQLALGVQNNRIAIIEGAVFYMPQSPASLYLIIQTMNYVIN